MNTTFTRPITEQQAEQLRLIDELDLGPIGFKLVHSESGETAMSENEAREAVGLYRMYLKLIVLYKDEKPIVPTKQIDRVWHCHLLDNWKYNEDCLKIFGFILYHFPYLGLRGEKDAKDLQTFFAETSRLFLMHFGVDLSKTPNCSGDSCTSECGDTGDPTSCKGTSSCSDEGPHVDHMRPRLAGI